MTLDDGSESGKRQGSFLFCPSYGCIKKMLGGVASSAHTAFMAVGGKLHFFIDKTAAVAVPNATAAVFLRYKSSASSRAREEAAKRNLGGLLTCVSGDGPVCLLGISPND